MKKLSLTFGFVIVLLSINSCRQDDVILSSDDVANLKIIQTKRINTVNKKSSFVKRDSTLINSTLKQDEWVKPPK
jgi:hypothetical protein